MCIEDIFSTSFDSDYQFIGCSKSELNMATDGRADGSGKVNEEIRIDRKSHSRNRSRYLNSKHRRDNEYKGRRHRDKPSQERTPPSLGHLPSSIMSNLEGFT